MRYLSIRIHASTAAVAICAVAFAPACSKKEESEESEEVTNGSGTVAVGDNALAESYPDTLAVTTFSSETPAAAADTSASGTIAVAYELSSALQLADLPPQGDMLPDAGPGQEVCGNDPKAYYAKRGDKLPDGVNASIFSDRADNKGPQAKIDEGRQRLRGEGECYSDDLAKQMKIIADSIRNPNLDGSGCYRPDWGILKGTFGDTGEVCIVGFARNELGKLGSYVDFSQLLLQAMLCQAQKDGLAGALPEPGTTLDLTASLKAGVLGGGDRISATSATLYRAADDGDRHVYRTDVELAFKEPDAANPLALTVGIHLIHSPPTAADSSYDGVLWIEHDVPKNDKNPKGGNRALSLTYESAKDDVGTRIKYELRAGTFDKSFAVFGDDGVLDFNTNAKFTGAKTSPKYGAYSASSTEDQNPYASNMNYVTWDGYPDLNVGKLSYWVSFGGRYTEGARGFVFDVKREDGVTKGCGIAGAVNGATETDAVSIRRALKEETSLYPNGFSKPFHCDEKTGSRVWQQCFTQNSDGDYVVDASKVKSDAGFDFLDLDGISADVKAPPRPPRGLQQPPPPRPDQPPHD